MEEVSDDVLQYTMMWSYLLYIISHYRYKKFNMTQQRYISQRDTVG